jgi:pyruvate formate-lyase activating enzyme-like uncharacterized protein
MKLSDRETVDATRRALGSRYQQLSFITPNEARAAGESRKRLLAELADRAGFAFKGSKPHLGELSPGCVHCGRGEWSCLFVGFECNASCFFCPGEGGDGSSMTGPTADGVVFDTPADFADYVRQFGIRAVAFSGGDPLLELDLVLDHLRELRRRNGDDLYVWLYTNGLLATADVLTLLRGAGLDEIRINIAATDYALDNVAAAARIIDRVTVEIPAIPEHRDLVQDLVTDMARVGVAHVNLHQLMLIGENCSAIQRCGGTLTHGPTPSVVESELAALELMRYAADAGFDLQMHYCATAYKARWLERAQRVRVNPFVASDLDGETETGLVRRLWVAASPVDLIAAAGELAAVDPEAKRWRPDAEAGRILIHRTLLRPVAERGRTVSVVYLRAGFVPVEETDSAEIRPEDIRFMVGDRTTIGASLLPVSPVISLSSWDALRFEELYGGDQPRSGPSGIDAVDPYECLGSGFPDYV